MRQKCQIKEDEAQDSKTKNVIVFKRFQNKIAKADKLATVYMQTQCSFPINAK